ncbi:MAG TPA: glycosyltransferase, partial [Coriobacteriia bacterium]|nr:glycosyltransferase [Coriobacteriia bacterium]
AASLDHFGLQPDKRTVLALAGASLPGPYKRFKESLAVALPAIASLPNAAVALVTGNDEAFAEEMKSRAAGFGTTNVHVFGYVEYMAPLMACADLGLAKPGGAICTESVAMHLPLVLVGPAAGQEAANARALHEAGVASYIADPRLIAEATRKVISKPPRLKAMRAAAEAIARPHATQDVAERVLGLASAKR